MLTKSRYLSNTIFSRLFTSSSKSFHSTHENTSGPKRYPGELLTSEQLIEMETKYTAKNYAPIPVVFSSAEGIYAWDPEGRRYYDFLSAYSAVNQGHRHPKIMAAFIDQINRITLSSRAFHNDVFPRFSKFMHDFFGYESVLPMNTGAEGVETAIKAARKWAYTVKKVPENEALIVAANDCFHGRTVAAISLSNDPDARSGFGPFMPGVRKVPFNDPEALERLFEKEGDKVAAFLVEPIQGEAGVIVPELGYLSKCKALCEKYNVLLIADEVQSGLGRSGKMLASEWDNVRPDIIILGKAISGGVYPLSCILADHFIMDCIRPGQHGSTYGGNPIACAVSMAALQVIKEENLCENSLQRGQEFRDFMSVLKERCPSITEVRGRGLFNAFEMVDEGELAYDACLALKNNGILAKPTHHHIIRFTPPLVITKEQLDHSMNIIWDTFTKLEKK